MSDASSYSVLGKILYVRSDCKSWLDMQETVQSEEMIPLLFDKGVIISVSSAWYDATTNIDGFSPWAAAQSEPRHRDPAYEASIAANRSV